MQTKKFNFLFFIFNCIILLSGLIWIFTNVGFDEEYQICLANRILQGDELLVHLWEPHQTSIFVCALLMALFKAVFKSYTGIVVFLQAVGIVLRLLVSAALFWSLKKETEKTPAYLAAVLFFMISPKDFAIPEYSNLQVWFATACFIFLIEYFRKQKTAFLILSAIMLCLEVIAYPSCVIVGVPLVFIIGFYSQKGKKVRDIIIFSATCFLTGAAVLAFLHFRYGFDYLAGFYRNMVSLEPSHDVSPISKLLYYGKDFGKILLIIAAALLISFIPSFILCKCLEKKADDKKKLFAGLFLLSSFIVFLIGFLVNILSVKNRCAYCILFLYIIGVGFFLRKYLSAEEKRIFDTGCAISIAGFIATLILTNLPFMVSGAYLVLAVALSVIPVKRFVDTLNVKTVKTLIFVSGRVFVCLLFLRCVYIRTPMTGREQICSIFNTDLLLVHSGPAKWIITDDLGAKKQQVTLEEYKQYVPEGSEIWITDGLVDDLGYLYGDYKVATPSSIPDPKYLPGLNEYWRLHPEKYPDVVICGAYGGELSYDLLKNEWFMDWLENDFKPVRYTDGEFYRYYYRE